jgi:hypothetical protein
MNRTKPNHIKTVGRLPLIVSAIFLSGPIISGKAAGQNNGEPTGTPGVRVGRTPDGHQKYFVAPASDSRTSALDRIRTVVESLAKPGDTILLEPGVHQLSRTIQISKPKTVTRRKRYTGGAQPLLQMSDDRPNKPENVIDSMFRIDASGIPAGQNVTLFGIAIDLRRVEAAIVVDGLGVATPTHGVAISIEKCRFDGGTLRQPVVLFRKLNGYEAKVAGCEFVQIESRASAGMVAFQDCVRPDSPKA